MDDLLAKMSEEICRSKEVLAAARVERNVSETRNMEAGAAVFRRANGADYKEESVGSASGHATEQDHDYKPRKKQLRRRPYQYRSSFDGLG